MVALFVVVCSTVRFSAAQVMRRMITGACPERVPCDVLHDNFVLDGGPGDVLAKVANETSWYPLAVRLARQSKSISAGARAKMVHALVKAAVTDSMCSLSYYGAEHFMTQNALMAQGTQVDREHDREMGEEQHDSLFICEPGCQ